MIRTLLVFGLLWASPCAWAQGARPEAPDAGARAAFTSSDAGPRAAQSPPGPAPAGRATLDAGAGWPTVDGEMVDGGMVDGGVVDAPVAAAPSSPASPTPPASPASPTSPTADGGVPRAAPSGTASDASVPGPAPALTSGEPPTPREPPPGGSGEKGASAAEAPTADAADKDQGVIDRISRWFYERFEQAAPGASGGVVQDRGLPRAPALPRRGRPQASPPTQGPARQREDQASERPPVQHPPQGPENASGLRGPPPGAAGDPAPSRRLWELLDWPFPIVEGSALSLVFLLLVFILAAAGVERLRRRLSLRGALPWALSAFSVLLRAAIGAVALLVALRLVPGWLRPALVLAIASGAVAVGWGLFWVVPDAVARLVLISERRLRVGQWVQAGAGQGWVEAIGLRALTLRAPDGTLLTLPNRELLRESFRTREQRWPEVRVDVQLPIDIEAARIRRALRDAVLCSPHTASEPAIEIGQSAAEPGLWWVRTRLLDGHFALLFEGQLRERVLEALAFDGVADGAPAPALAEAPGAAAEDSSAN